MKWALATAISLLIFASHPALAQIDIAPESTALLCFNPDTGEQITIDLTDAPSGTCPEGYQSFPKYEFEKVPGADPQPYEPPQEQKQDEARDAQPNHK